MRKPFDKSAPRRPPTGFTLFTKQRRLASAELASLSLPEYNRILGAEWNTLSSEEKQVYIAEALKLRENYNAELQEYKKSDTYKKWLSESKQSQQKPGSTGKKRKVDSLVVDSVHGKQDPDCKVPIFTPSFLEYNRLRETVLRSLKKKAVQLEEETALLSKHVENLVSAEARVRTQIETNSKLLAEEEQLSKRLHREVASALSELTLPCEETVCPGGTVARGSERITENSVDVFLAHLRQLHEANLHPSLVAKAVQLIRSAIGKKTLKLVTL